MLVGVITQTSTSGVAVGASQMTRIVGVGLGPTQHEGMHSGVLLGVTVLCGVLVGLNSGVLVGVFSGGLVLVATGVVGTGVRVGGGGVGVNEVPPPHDSPLCLVIPQETTRTPPTLRPS